MARSRNIKPGFFKNETLAECLPLARILFAGLWCEADREGRLEDRPRRLKAEYLPYDECDANGLLDELAERGFIVRYQAKGMSLICIPNFSKHQNPHVREPASNLPAQDEHSASTVQEPGEHRTGHADSSFLIPDSLLLIPSQPLSIADAPAERKRKPRLTNLPDGFGISNRVREWAKRKGYSNLDAHLESFLSAVKRKGYQYADWDEALMTAIRDDWGKVGAAQQTPTVREWAK